MNAFALTFVLMLAFVLAELCVLKFARRQAIPWKEVVFNLNSGHILMWVLRGVEILAFSLVLKYASLHWVDRWPAPWQWVFALIGWDLCFYWMHRLHHKLPWLWAVHVVHHQGEHFGLSLAIRNSWYSSLTNFPFVAVLAVLGVPLEIFVVVSSFHYGVQFYNHNALVNKSGFLDKVLVTPSNHRVHHGTDPIYIDRNFGGTFLVWDKLFGTWQPERDDVEMRYGVIGGGPRSNNPLWASNPGLLRFLGRTLPRLASLRRVIVPGWYVGAAGGLLFGLVIYYVNRESRLADGQQLALFLFIFSGTIAIGAVSDDKWWGLLAWGALSVSLPVVLIMCYGMHDPWAWLLFALVLVHGLEGVRRLLTDAAKAHGTGVDSL